MAGKILIFAGAPESSLLDWDSPNLLLHLQEPLARFAGLNPPCTPPAAPAPAPGSLPQYAVWRALSLEKEHLTSGLSQRHDIDYAPQLEGNSHFFTTSFTSVAEEGDGADSTNVDPTHELVSQFYEHSLAVYNEIPSSQLNPSTGEAQDSSVLTNDSSNWTADSSHEVLPKEPIGRNGDGHVSHLQDIPSAAYLAKIHPQTVTVNLVVGIISIAAPRTVKTRWGSSRILVEVLVGDETRSGFAVTFWLPSDSVDQSVLAGLRCQDVVLMQNVALNVFMRKVYGSSLRKDLTKVHLLHRKRLDAVDSGGYYTAADLASTNTPHPQLDKTKRVREWVLKFVAIGGCANGNKAPERPWDRPPDDTQ